MGMIGIERTNFSIKLQSLKEGLRLFGLDPKEWQIKESSGGFLMIENLREPGLSFQGQAYTMGHRWDWQEISLAAV